MGIIQKKQEIKLVGMTNFVLEQEKIGLTYLTAIEKCINYAKFLKQPLELWMFVPCDEDGNVLEKPREFKNKFSTFEKYQQAKERCLFEGFEIDTKKNGNKYVSKKDWLIIFASTENDNGIFRLFSKFSNIESLIKYNIQLTQTAQKQIGL